MIDQENIRVLLARIGARCRRAVACGGRSGVGIPLSFLWAVVLLQCLSACADEGQQPPKPPLDLPIAIHKAGVKVETEMRVVEHRSYIFGLTFKFNKDDEAEYSRVKKLVGDDIQDKAGDPGVPTPLRLRISAIEEAGERVVVDKEINELRLRSWGGDSLKKHIDYIQLSPGLYHLSIETLQDAPQLEDVSVLVSIGFYSKL